MKPLMLMTYCTCLVLLGSMHLGHIVQGSQDKYSTALQPRNTNLRQTDRQTDRQRHTHKTYSWTNKQAFRWTDTNIQLQTDFH
jgi:hypothetical protein